MGLCTEECAVQKEFGCRLVRRERLLGGGLLGSVVEFLFYQAAADE